MRQSVLRCVTLGKQSPWLARPVGSRNSHPAKLKDSDASDTTKILNLRKILVTAVQQDGLSKPFLLSIGDRAEKLAEAYEDRQLTTQQALLEFEKLAREATEADLERQRLGLDENTFAIYKVVSVLCPSSNGTKAKALNALFESLPDFRWDKQQESRLRTELYKALRPLVGTEKMIDLANQLLRLQRVWMHQDQALPSPSCRRITGMARKNSAGLCAIGQQESA